MFALQKTFDDQFNNDDYNSRPRTPEENRARAAAERQLNDDLRTALGEDRWAAQQRANDGEFRLLGDLAKRLNLAVATPDQIYAVRDTYAAQSAVINQNAALGPADRRTQLIDLAARAKADVRAKLGTEGAEAYAGRAGWLQMLQNGTAFTTDPRNLPADGGRSLGGTAFALPPPRPAVPPKS